VGVPARALGLVFGYAADLAFADPRRGHPVAAFGRLASAMERTCWADDRTRGAAYTGVLVCGITGAGWVAQCVTRGRPVAEAAIVAVATWAVLGGRSVRYSISLKCCPHSAHPCRLRAFGPLLCRPKATGAMNTETLRLPSLAAKAQVHPRGTEPTGMLAVWGSAVAPRSAKHVDGAGRRRQGHLHGGHPRARVRSIRLDVRRPVPYRFARVCLSRLDGPVRCDV
jgi:hypothetical protein